MTPEESFERLRKKIRKELFINHLQAWGAPYERSLKTSAAIRICGLNAEPMTKVIMLQGRN